VLADANRAAATAEVRELLVAFDTAREPRLLTEAVLKVRRLLAAPDFADVGETGRAFVWTLGAVALTWRARTAAAGADDLDRAIEWSDRAVEAWPADDVNLPRAQSNLATALTDRYGRSADPADLERALLLFDAAVPALAANGERVDVALHGHGLCHHERATAIPDGGGAADWDRAIELFRAAVDCREPDADERAGYLNSLGLSLQAKGRSRGDRGLVSEAIAVFSAARECAVPGGDNHVGTAMNLASALQDRAAADDDVGLLQESVRLYREVLPYAAEDRHQQITNNLATALIDVYRYTRDGLLLEEAARDLRRRVVGIPAGDRRWRMLANLGAALHEMYRHTGRLALLDEAIAAQEELLASPNPCPPERTLNVGLSLLSRCRRRHSNVDLDRALALFEEAALSRSPVERASALNSQANALSMRFEDTGVRADLDRCVRLRERAIATAPEAIEVAMYRGNLGVDLLMRFSLAGDERDLEQAVDEQRQAVSGMPAGSVAQPDLLAGLANSLASLAGRTRRHEDVSDARSAYRRAVEAGRASRPEQALGSAMRWGAWESEQRCWAEAAAAYDLGLEAMSRLVGRQQQRDDKESWLGAAEGMPAAAGLAHARAGSAVRAVIAMEHGRAMLLAEALQRQHPARRGL